MLSCDTVVDGWMTVCTDSRRRLSSSFLLPLLLLLRFFTVAVSIVQKLN